SQRLFALLDSVRTPAVTALELERFIEAPVRVHEFRIGTTRTNTRPKIVMPMATAAIGNKI
ncbi:MAG: hypothetical protein WAN94_11405, partial [Pseudolabrys sp.]